MSAKLQRWIDLVATIVGRHAPITLEQLRDEIPAYGAIKTKTALRRTFERDKDELRALGVPIETLTTDEVSGYRIRAADFYLPYLAAVIDGRRKEPPRVDRDGYRALNTLAFEPDEVPVLRRAVARVRSLGLVAVSQDAERAVRKLALDLPDLLGDGPDGATSVPTDGGDAFDPLMDALSHRRKVRFRYYAMGGDTHSTRDARPYGLFLLNGHWYLAAVEEDAPAGPVKNFRLSRIRDVTPLGTSQARAQYEIPPTFRLSEHARDRKPWELGDAESRDVVVEFTAGDGATTAAMRLGAAVPGKPAQRRFEVRRADVFVRWLLSYGGAARPVSPPDLVTAWREECGAVAALYVAGAGD